MIKGLVSTFHLAVAGVGGLVAFSLAIHLLAWIGIL